MSQELLERLRTAFEPSQEVLNGSGIYALWADAGIVYIGKAKRSIAKRLRSHARNLNKEFDRVSAVRVAEKHLIGELEGLLIARLKPRFNKAIPTGAEGRKRRREAKACRGAPIPRECDLCHELTDDEYALETPQGSRLVCPGCRNEHQLFACLRAFGCLTNEGKLTGELDVILKRHYPRRYSS